MDLRRLRKGAAMEDIPSTTEVGELWENILDLSSLELVGKGSVQKRIQREREYV